MSGPLGRDLKEMSLQELLQEKYKDDLRATISDLKQRNEALQGINHALYEVLQEALADWGEDHPEWAKRAEEALIRSEIGK